jgi:hypothetical protein
VRHRASAISSTHLSTHTGFAAPMSSRWLHG